MSQLSIFCDTLLSDETRSSNTVVAKNIKFYYTSLVLVRHLKKPLNLLLLR
jgi:hypothetical protein